MKTLLIAITLLFSLSSFSQARLDSPKQDVLKEFPNATVGIIDTIDYIMVKEQKTVTFHYFNENSICYASVIIPQNDYVLMNLIEYYDSHYTMMSQVVWRTREKNRELQCTLKHNDDGEYMLCWEILQ